MTARQKRAVGEAIQIWQAVAPLLIVALLAWGGATLVELRDRVTALEGRTEDRYYARDAQRDFQLRDERLQRLSDRVSVLEER